MTLFCAALKKITGVDAVRPDIAGIMGAFGAAFIARERYDGISDSSMLSIDKINNLTEVKRPTVRPGTAHAI